MTIRELVNLLSDAYVTYELLIRQEDVARHTLLTKKARLVTLLEEEDRNPDNAVHLRCSLPAAEDVAECKILLGDLKQDLVQDRVNNAAMVDSRIKFLNQRIDRIVIPEIDQENLLSKNKLIEDIKSLTVEVGKIAVPISSCLSGIGQLSDNDIRSSTNVNPNRSNPFLDECFFNNYSNVPHQVSNHVPVWKWDLRFSGDIGSISATEFLQNVGDFSRSRDVSERELFVNRFSTQVV